MSLLNVVKLGQIHRTTSKMADKNEANEFSKLKKSFPSKANECHTLTSHQKARDIFIEHET